MISFSQRIMFIAIAVLIGLKPVVCGAQVLFAKQDVATTYLFQGVDEATFKKQLEDKTFANVNRIASMVAIDEAQQRKLRLAVTGDLNRFYRELNAFREETKGIDMQKQADMQQVWQKLMPLQTRLHSGILDSNSLYEKVLTSTLTVEQREIYDTYLRERDVAFCKSVLRAVIADMEKEMLPLTSKQRAALIKLAERNGFPSKIDSRNPYLGHALLGRVTDADVATLLDAQQQKTFSDMKVRYAQYANRVQW